MAGINRVGHVVLFFEDIDRATAFYRDKIGMEVVRASPQRVFMSFGDYHHNLALFQVRGEPTRGNLGLAHVAFVISGGIDELREVHDRLVAEGVEILEKVDHGFIRSFRFKDPEGNNLEIYCEAKAPLEGKKFLAENPGYARPFEFQAAVAPQ